MAFGVIIAPMKPALIHHKSKTPGNRSSKRRRRSVAQVVDEPIYGSQVLAIYAPNWQRFEELVLQYLDEEELPDNVFEDAVDRKGQSAAVCYTLDPFRHIVWFIEPVQGFEGLNTIAHEIDHAVRFISEGVGSKCRELTAHLAGYYVEHIAKLLKLSCA